MPESPYQRVLDEIAAERRRQIEIEGWTPEHDDVEHPHGEMSQAAATYALEATRDNHYRDDGLPVTWPWSSGWWKPKDRRRNLIRAAALVVAEIERIDRSEALTARHGGRRVRLSDLKPGDTIVADAGFTCVIAGRHTILSDGELFIECNEGRHYLDGQKGEDGYLVGISLPPDVGGDGAAAASPPPRVNDLIEGGSFRGRVIWVGAADVIAIDSDCRKQTFRHGEYRVLASDT